jgi:hypothetical protein
MVAAKVRAEIEVYPNALHGFGVPDSKACGEPKWMLNALGPSWLCFTDQPCDYCSANR